MARNGSGTYNRAVSPYVAGTTITAATVNSEMDDIATALTGSMARDGQSPATANIPMGGFRLTGLANAIANTDAAALGQVLAKAGDTATGALGVIAGTAAAPGVFVSGDTNTGLFQPSADTLAVTVGGAEVARFGANGLQSAAPWVDLASAATTDLGAQTTDNLRITGTTTITSFGTAANGVTRNLRFAGALTLTQNGTSLILPGAANITTAAGDTGTAKSLGSGNWVLTDFQRATGNPLVFTPSLFSVGINRGTAQNTTSGSQIDFTGIPAGVRRIILSFNGVSTNGTNVLLLQIGDGSIITSGYNASSGNVFGTNQTGVINSSNGFPVSSSGAALIRYGHFVLTNISGNGWVVSHVFGESAGAGNCFGAGFLSLSGVLDRVRITTVGGTDTFDAGAINIMWEF